MIYKLLLDFRREIGTAGFYGVLHFAAISGIIILDVNDAAIVTENCRAGTCQEILLLWQAANIDALSYAFRRMCTVFGGRCYRENSRNGVRRNRNENQCNVH